MTFCPPRCQRELASDIPECESNVQRFTAAVTPKQALGLPRFWQVKVYDTLMCERQKCLLTKFFIFYCC